MTPWGIDVETRFARVSTSVRWKVVMGWVDRWAVAGERLAGPCSGVYPPARWQPAPGLRVEVPSCLVIGAHPEGAGADSRNADWPAPSSRRVPPSACTFLVEPSPSPPAHRHTQPQSRLSTALRGREKRSLTSTLAPRTRGAVRGHEHRTSRPKIDPECPHISFFFSGS